MIIRLLKIVILALDKWLHKVEALLDAKAEAIVSKVESLVAPAIAKVEEKPKELEAVVQQATEEKKE